MTSTWWPLLRRLCWPFSLTLAVTLVRLAGELLAGPQLLFGTAAGGGLALVGIGWLVPVFGWRFARQLAATSAPRPRAWSRVGAGFGLTIGAFAVAAMAMPRTGAGMVCGAAGAILGSLRAGSAWPQLARLLLAYAVAARLPIVAITAIAIVGDFGTHYEKLADGAAAMAPLPRFLVLALAQAVFWLPITVLGGTLAGLLAVLRR